MTDRLMERFYHESRFGGFTDIDGTVAFYLRVNALAASKDVVLDFGCGQGTYANDPLPIRLGLRVLKDKVSKVMALTSARVGRRISLYKFRPFASR